MENLCDTFPTVPLFIPTSAVMQKLILKASQLSNDEDILLIVNPKEKKRLVNE